MRKLIPFYTAIYIFLLINSAVAQQADTAQVFSFINAGSNIIENSQSLQAVFDKLRRIQSGQKEKLTVYHFGDSHVRAFQFPKELASRMQYKFGNAGGNLLYNKQNTRKYRRKGRYRTVVKESRQVGVTGLNSEGESGIEFNAYGVSGKTYAYFAKSAVAEKHLRTYRPDLVIISLGTNEAFGPAVDQPAIYNDITRCIALVRNIVPGAAIILTIPPDCYRKKVYNDKVLTVRDAIIKYAKDNNTAYWDLLHVMGGITSRLKWFDAGLSQKDLVHFTPQGYKLQGDLLFEAFDSSYCIYRIRNFR